MSRPQQPNELSLLSAGGESLGQVRPQDLALLLCTPPSCTVYIQIDLTLPPHPGSGERQAMPGDPPLSQAASGTTSSFSSV